MSCKRQQLFILRKHPRLFCVVRVASFSVFSVFYCPFGFLERLFNNVCIVFSVLFNNIWVQFNGWKYIIVTGKLIILTIRQWFYSSDTDNRKQLTYEFLKTIPTSEIPYLVSYTFKSALVTIFIKQQLCYLILILIVPSHWAHFIFIKPVFSNHLSYATLFQCFRGRLYKTS